MTSNLGSDLIRGMSEESYDAMKNAVMGVVSEQFRPEFLNRVDDAVVFHALEKDQIADIARIQLQALQKRLMDSGICIKFDSGALSYLVDVGYDPAYGARPLKRAIQQHIENPLAQALLEGRFTSGDIVEVRRVGDRLGFSK